MLKFCAVLSLLLLASQAQSEQCSNIPLDYTEQDVKIYVKELASSLTRGGQINPVIDFDLGRASVGNIRVPLDSINDSPVHAAIAFVTKHSAGKIQLEEYLPQEEPEWSNVGSYQLNLGRYRVGEYPTPFFAPAFSIVLSKEQGTWYALQIRVYPPSVFANAKTVKTLKTCTAQALPQERLSVTTFQGSLYKSCDVVGSYNYTSRDTDKFAYTSEPRWVAMKREGEASSSLSWRIIRKATLVIEPSNYWPEINESDCFCHSKAGYELDVDVVTGTVTRYQPGLGCVVC
jgi:hypothetical protein